jgi:polysulfide reductase chain C
MQTAWGWMASIYLFLGGLGAGALIVAAVFELSNERYRTDFCPTTLVGATVAGPAVALGAVLLILELGAGLRQPWRILYMFTHFTSVMTWGIWILSLFIPTALVYGLLEVVDTFPAVQAWIKGRKWGHKLTFQNLRRIKRIVAAVGLALAVGTAVYTGVLLSAVGPAIPLWSTSLLPFLHLPLLPFLFLVSAVSTGEALTVDLINTIVARGELPRGRKVHLIHLSLIVAEALLISHMLTDAMGEGGAAAQAALDIIAGPHSIVFWVFIILLAIVFPFVGHIYAAGLGRHLPFSGLSSGISILMSGLFLRYLIVVSGIPVFL